MDVNDIKTLYGELKKKRTILNWAEFAEKIGFSRSHLSAVINGKEELTPDLVKAIERVFVNPTNNVGHGVDAKDYKHLQEKFKMLNDHHRTINDVVRTNLASLSTMQLVILAEIKAGLQWEAIKASKGNKKKELEIRGELSMIVGENLRAFGVADKNFEMGKLDNRSSD